MHAPASYASDLGRMRAEKDAFFRRDPHSPLEHRGSFAGLRYFPVDPAFRVVATWEPAASAQQVGIATSTGEDRDYLDAGVLRFRVADGGERTLKGFIGQGRPHELFVPFRDATSGKESYGAARYLEVERPHGGARETIIDFNLAYNPWCAYSEAYSCPLPPRENWLDVPIPAGEKAFET